MPHSQPAFTAKAAKDAKNYNRFLMAFVQLERQLFDEDS